METLITNRVKGKYFQYALVQELASAGGMIFFGFSCHPGPFYEQDSSGAFWGKCPRTRFLGSKSLRPFMEHTREQNKTSDYSLDLWFSKMRVIELQPIELSQGWKVGNLPQAYIWLEGELTQFQGLTPSKTFHQRESGIRNNLVSLPSEIVMNSNFYKLVAFLSAPTIPSNQERPPAPLKTQLTINHTTLFIIIWPLVSSH